MIAALIFTYLFEVGFLDPSILTIIMVLCTLHGPEPRRGRVDISRYPPLHAGPTLTATIDSGA